MQALFRFTKSTFLVVLLASGIFLMSRGPASSTPVLTIVEPDDFAIGTVLTDAFPGVTLTVVGDGSETDSSIQTVIAESGFSAFNGTNLATTGSFVFGKEPFSPGGCVGCESSVWNEDAFNLLRADFEAPTDFVQIDLIFRDDDIAFLRVFDAADNLLAELIRFGDGRADDLGEEPFFTVSVSRPTQDIAYIVAGGLGGEGAFLDNLQYNRFSVAEPSAITLAALCFAGIFWFRVSCKTSWVIVRRGRGPVRSSSV